MTEAAAHRSCTNNLSELNLAIHQRIDELYFAAVAAVTACDYPKAMQISAGLQDILARHMEFEDRKLLPILQTADASATRLVDGDHTILRRRLRLLITTLGELHRNNAGRNVMVRSLPRILALHGTLEHHTDREQNLMYPRLDAVLGCADAARLMADMERTLRQTPRIQP